MKLNRIEYTNYRGLKTGTMSFDNNLTVIAGKNGAGKTSVLMAVATAVSWIIARIRAEKGSGSYISEEEITNGYLHSQLTAYFDEFGDGVQIPNRQKKGIAKKYAINIAAIRDYALQKREEIENTNFSTSIPVFAFYGVKRAVLDIPLRIWNKDTNMFDAYGGCLNGAANFRDFFMWFRNQEDIENESRNRNDGVIRDNTRELDTFRRAMAVFMPDYTDIHVRRHPLRMLLNKHGEMLNVAQLSDGEKIYFALIGDLCRRLVLANPTLEDPLLGEGIVMIDELDLHLHPQWQGEIADKLNKVFPNIQFIVTTHSPHVINRIQSSCLRILKNGEILTADYSYGMPSEIVLKDIMGLSNDQPEVVENAFSAIYTAIANGNSDQVMQLYGHLMNEVPEHPELTRVRKLIGRLNKNPL